MLRTNIELDEKLVDEAMKLTDKKTKKELVNFALSELVSLVGWVEHSETQQTTIQPLQIKPL